MWVEGCVRTSTPLVSRESAERVRQGLGLLGCRVGGRTGSGMCSRGLRGLSPVQGPYCQARSNCLSSSISASSTLRGWGSSPAMTCCSSGLPKPVPCRAGPLLLASQLTHCSPALTAPLPLLSTARSGVGSRGHTSLPLPLPKFSRVPHIHSSRPPTPQRPSSGASSPLLCPAEPSLLFTTG